MSLRELTVDIDFGDLDIRKLTKMDTAIDELEDSTEDWIKDVDKATDETGKLGKEGGKSFGKLKAVGVGALAAIGASLASAAVAGVKWADEMNKSYRDIMVGTGATGEQLEGLKDDFKNVMGSIATDSDTAASSISALNTMTGATGETLQELSTGVLEASRLLGEDGARNAEAYGKMLDQWQIGAEQGVKEMDKLFVATQKYGIGFNDLTGQLTEYGSVLNNAGFSMQETADLFGRLNKSGLSVSRVMPGLNAAFRNWAKEGKDAKKEFGDMIDVISNTEDRTKALAIATDTFGAEGAQRIVKAIKNGAMPALEDLGDGLDGATGAIDDLASENMTLGETMQLIGNKAKIAFEPMGSEITKVIQKGMPLIESFFEVTGEGMSDVVNALGKGWNWLKENVFKPFGDWVMDNQEIFTSFGNSVMDVVDSVVSFLKTVWSVAGDEVIAIVSNLWDGVVTLFKGAMTIIGDILDVTAAMFTGDWSKAWEGIGKLMIDTWNTIIDTLEAINLFDIGKNIIGGLVDGIKAYAGNVVKEVKEVAGNIKDGFLDFFKIKSPSRVMADEIGAQLPAGIEMGMSKNAKKVIDGAKNMGQGITAASMGATNKTINNHTTNNPTFNITVQGGGNDNRAVAQEIKKEMEKFWSNMQLKGV